MKRLLLPLLLACPLLPAQERATPDAWYVLLPEPRALRAPFSLTPAGAEKTVLTPARALAAVPGVEAYSKEEFRKLGLSPATFAERAREAADRRLQSLQPELVRDAAGKVRYAVFRGDSPLTASLLVAPSLPKRLEPLFGAEVWAALPDRHSLFVFPARPEAVEEFVADLAERYRTDPHAASPEIFALKAGAEPRVVAAFSP